MFLTETSVVWILAVVVGTLVVRADHSTAAPQSEDSQGALECAKGFVLHDKSCYHYSGHDTTKAFHQAEKACRRRKACLVSVHSSSEHDFVAQLTQYNASFWIGLNDADGPADHHTEGVFKWTDGNPFVETGSYSRWKEGEPLNQRHLDCVRSDADGWSVARGGCASTRLPYVCEMEACLLGLQWNGDKCVRATSTAWPPSLLIVSFTAASALASIGLLVAMTHFVYHRTNSNKTHTFSSKFMLPT